MTRSDSVFAWLPRRSLKLRVTLVTVAIFVLSVWVLAFHISRLLREDMLGVLSKHQFSTASFMAEEANRELGDRLVELGRTAALLGRNFSTRPEELRAFIEARPVLMEHFSGGLIVLDITGRALVDEPAHGRAGLDITDVAPVAGSLREGKSTIGPPRDDPVLGTPVFNMSVPIRDLMGVVIGALVGVVDLSKPGFLDQITGRYYGKSGFFLLEDPKTRRIVTDTGKGRVYEALPPIGVNPVIDRFVAGYDETAIVDVKTGPQAGMQYLASARRVPVADWFLVAALPDEEAFALIYSMQKNLLQATLILTVLAGALTWWLLSRELSPIMTAIKTLSTLSNSDEPPKLLTVDRDDEIGRLIGGFNRLLETLAVRERLLQDTLRFQSALMDAVPSPVFYKNVDGVYIGCNKAFENYIGRAHGEIVGKTVYDLAPLDLAEKYDQADRALLASPGVQFYEAAVVYADQTRHDVIFHKATFTDADGQLSGQIGVILDITERKQMERQMRRQALHDALTQLPNRRLLGDRLRQTLAINKRNGRYCALMFLDLDNFKPLNDQFGHEVGDLLLIEVAARLKTTVREMDTVARFGGDEFVVILTDLGPALPAATGMARKVAEKIRQRLAEPYRLVIRQEGKADQIVDHRSTASIGLVICNDRDAGPDEVMKQADSAMYQAKEGGRDAVRLYGQAIPMPSRGV